jgi:hypothetical protein
MPTFRVDSRPNLLKLHQPETPRRSSTQGASPGPKPKDVVYWRVNGYRAAMLVWTDDEFERLAAYERPADAQHFSCGIWAVLRMV